MFESKETIETTINYQLHGEVQKKCRSQLKISRLSWSPDRRQCPNKNRLRCEGVVICRWMRCSCRGGTNNWHQRAPSNRRQNIDAVPMRDKQRACHYRLATDSDADLEMWGWSRPGICGPSYHYTNYRKTLGDAVFIQPAVISASFNLHRPSLDLLMKAIYAAINDHDNECTK